MSKRTIDYYTQMGLLAFTRTESNYRLYEEGALHDLHLIEHYKKLNMPLAKVKETLELMKKKGSSPDLEKVENHIEQVITLIQHLQEEMNEIVPLFEDLTEQQRETLLGKFSPQSVCLAKSILMLFNQGVRH